MLGNEYVLYDMDAVPKLDAISFDPHNLAERQALVGEVRGRGLTYFIRIEQQDWVLRHYQRGGIVARFVQDSYVWMGLHRTRPWREWHMLQKLYSWQLPVPRPIAARASRHGLFYKADIITQRLVDARSLTEWIKETQLSRERWRAIGTCIRRFHDADVSHPDITSDNILLEDGDGVYLIDFDKCKLRHRSTSWRAKNLGRLNRSLVKRRSIYKSFNFSDADWQALCEGYREKD
jgi:3-deoxy-D-manno-octulosonic acid kinase